MLLINKETPQRGQRGRNSVSGACARVTFLSFEMSGAISALWSSESNVRSRSRVAVYRLCFFWLLSVCVTRWHVCGIDEAVDRKGAKILEAYLQGCMENKSLMYTQLTSDQRHWRLLVTNGCDGYLLCPIVRPLDWQLGLTIVIYIIKRI